jgi:fructose-bisphosphate aldolase class 1
VTAQKLIETAQKLVRSSKGLLAMDERNPTCSKRFVSPGTPRTQEAKSTYRKLILTAASTQ